MKENTNTAKSVDTTYPKSMMRGNAWKPVRFWDYIEVETPEEEQEAKKKGFYVVKKDSEWKL